MKYLKLESKSALVLLSSGLDSTANLAFAIDEGISVSALTFDYGQNARSNELEHSKKICEYYGVEQKTINLPFFSDFSKSALHNLAEMPEFSSSELDMETKTRASAAVVWVPNRNGVFIHIGAMVAESMQINTLLVGFNREEAETFPDNSKAYMDIENQALAYSTKNRVYLKSYTDGLSKREIVLATQELSKQFPLDLIWSCYRSGAARCGRCESCKRFERACSC